ncbi:MAG: hypothetical protein HY897_08875 [Deltaproteobacteria bacterium]|nr:hypothetical protein [Deltaproteobacteria bacterium]
MKRGFVLLLSCALVVGWAADARAEERVGAEGRSDNAVLLAKARKVKSKAAKPQPKKEPADEKAKARPEGVKAGDKTPAQAEKAEPAAQGPEGGPMLQRSNRLEFDARLIQGQLAKSGAIFLFDRAPRPLPPLFKLRRSYLDDIVEPELGADYRKPRK